MKRALLVVALVACGKGNEPQQRAASGSAEAKAPLDIKAPPADARKTASGIVYKKLTENPSGRAPKRNDTVMLKYTGWKQTSGKTFVVNPQPLPVSLASTTAGFAEGIQLVKTGEHVMLWIPSDKETLVYDVELSAIAPAPEIPTDLASPPADAKTSAHGARYVVITPGAAEKPRSFDTVHYHYSAWDSEGRMFDSTELRKRTASAAPFRQVPVIEDMLLQMGKGERIRMWTDATQMSANGTPPGMPKGVLVYEIQVEDIIKAKADPAPVPPDVAAPPPDAKRTARGVAYRMLKTGTGAKPTATDLVKIHYTGWTTEGRLVASTALEGSPETITLTATLPGWAEVIPLLAVGDRVRIWVPDTLAFKGQPHKPQGMIVYDLELVSFDAKATAIAPAQPPPDVAGAPANAKTTASGVAYKILRPKASGKHPTPKDTVRVIYTGWTTDGKMFDSSKGKPYETKLTNVIDGWAEAIPLMAVGEKARLWIPERMAYAGEDPKGTLVFDIELLEIVK